MFRRTFLRALAAAGLAGFLRVVPDFAPPPKLRPVEIRVLATYWQDVPIDPELLKAHRANIERMRQELGKIGG